VKKQKQSTGTAAEKFNKQIFKKKRRSDASPFYCKSLSLRDEKI